METKQFDDRLVKFLKKEVLIEKWKKKFRAAGEIIKKRATRKGSMLFTIKTKKAEYDVVVPKHRKEEFELAKDIKEGIRVKIIGEKQASGIIFCDRIAKISRNSLNEKQIKLI